MADGFEPRNVKQACYELRASSVYHTDLHAAQSQRIDVEVNGDGDILIRPHQLVVIITEEELSLPADVLGRVLSKGQLFSLGLVPVNTYADPGFKGQLGIVLLNASPNYVRILPGDAIAKIEFTRLPKAVETQYHGQHGYSAKIWPVKPGAVLTAEEVRRDARIGSPSEELARAYGPDFERMMTATYGRGRLIWATMIAYVTLATLLMAVAVEREDRLGIGVAVVTGVIANAMTAAVLWVSTRLRRRP